jgi:transcriptional regulator with XRE-family HTH domain
VQNPNLTELGERIRQRRKARGWTQEQFADEAGLDRSYAGGIERGERNITFSVLCQICAALACDVAMLGKGLPSRQKK